MESTAQVQQDTIFESDTANIGKNISITLYGTVIPPVMWRCYIILSLRFCGWNLKFTYSTVSDSFVDLEKSIVLTV